MARPAPQIYLVRTDPTDAFKVEIRAAKGVWVVLYDGQTFNEVKSWEGRRDWRYERSLFGNPGYAFVTARRLNAEFETDKFTVHKMEVVSDALADPTLIKLQKKNPESVS